MKNKTIQRTQFLWALAACVTLLLTVSFLLIEAKSPSTPSIRIAGLPEGAEVAPVQVAFEAGLPAETSNTIQATRAVSEGWQLVFANSFEGTLDIGEWTAMDGNGSANGDYFWGLTDYTYASASRSMWAIGNGLDGFGLDPASDVYTNSVDSWFIVGPVDLKRVRETELRFQLQVLTQPGDQVQLLSSPDGAFWSGAGFILDGLSLPEWFGVTANLDTFLGDDSVWFAIRFVSNEDGLGDTGVFIDDVYLRINYGYNGYLPVAVKGHRFPTQTPTPSPTPTATPTSGPKNDFYDDFTSGSTGWGSHVAACCLSGCDVGGAQEHPNYKYNLYYEGGRYHIDIPLDCRAGGNHGDTRHIYPLMLAPDVERSSTETCVEAAASFEEFETYWSFWGLAFAASQDKSTVYTLEVNDIGDWAVVKRTGYDFPGPNHPFDNEIRTKIEDYAGVPIGSPRWPARPAYEVNTLRAEVENDRAKLYINGERVYTLFDAGIVPLRHVGFMGGDWEISPTKIGFDYFFVDEGCDTYTTP